MELHPLVFLWVARVVRALYLVGSTDIAIIGLDSLAGLKEVTEDLVENKLFFGSQTHFWQLARGNSWLLYQDQKLWQPRPTLAEFFQS